MHAAVLREFGPPEVLAVEQVPEPSPIPTEVKVRVRAAGVNPVDFKTRAGKGMAGVLGEPPLRLGRSPSCDRADCLCRCRAACPRARESRRRVTGFLVEPDPVGLAGLDGLVEAGKLQVHVDRAFELEQVAEAHRAAEDHHGGGKIVLRI